MAILAFAWTTSVLGSDAELFLKPTLCIVARDSGQCTLDVDVRWQANESSDYCLYNDINNDPVRCWSSQKKGQASNSIDIAQNIDYWLVKRLSNEELDRKVLTVVKIVPDDRRKARRRRHIWSVF